ncbi:MAG: ABC transporter ATP-binding protein [Rhodobacteraceae bacterium]|nr:ABC transporter ATP-binding protein [Paracoccaceae bacterium]
MAGPIIAFVDTSKSYDGRTVVVDALNLEIRRGELITLLGPSGCGKTTSLMMLAGFESPTAGDILLNGRSLVKVPPWQRNMGLVFQSYALFPHKTVFDNIAFPLVHRRIPRREVAAKVVEILELTELGAMRDRYPAQLSGGQQQRVALARALVFRPEVVLLDEPLSALDKNLREQMQTEIKALHRTFGMTFIFVTHDQGEALTLSDRVAIFDRGRLQQVATPREIYDHPANEFVAGFVGENNILAGTVEGLEGAFCRVRLATGDAALARPAPGLRAGDPVALAVRPEKVAFAPDDGAAVNRLPATVSETVYSGDMVRIRLTAADGSTLTRKAIAASQEEEALAAGAPREVRWRPEDCYVFPRTSGRP